MIQSWHVYIARGKQAASTDFVVEAPDPEQARAQVKREAAALWEDDPTNMAAHLSCECDGRGCNG
jgi:hypothetical protein